MRPVVAAPPGPAPVSVPQSAPEPPSPSSPSSNSPLQDAFQLLFPFDFLSEEERSSIWSIWWDQAWVFNESHARELSYAFLQPKNGPCGVLAAIQARVYLEAFFTNPELTREEALARALYNALAAAQPDEVYTILLPLGGRPEPNAASLSSCVRVLEVEGELAYLTFIENASLLSHPGALVCFVLSLVLSRKVAVVSEEMNSTSNPVNNPFQDRTLVAGELGFCTTAIVALCGFGRAVFDLADAKLLKSPQVGFLSHEESDDDLGLQLVGSHLKCPSYPVWIVFVPGHFCTLMADNRRLVQVSPNAIADQGVTSHLTFYNGLPPVGPVAERWLLTFQSLHEAPSSDPEAKKILSIVSRRGTGAAGSTNPRDYQYEITFEPDALIRRSGLTSTDKWRCLHCTSQQPPVWSAYNKAESPVCSVCGQNRSEAGETVFVTYDQLPPQHQLQVDTKYAPPLLGILRSQWPQVKLLSEK